MQLGLFSPLYLRKLFERMGATYIKLGQLIASAPTLFPPEYVEEFQKCFDRVPTVPFEEIQSILHDELGTIDSVYEYIDPVSIASASIAQVHGARLKGSSEDVVIKVLKRGIEDILVTDPNFVYIVARILEFLNPELSRASMVDIIKDIKESMLEEVDFRKEAANIESFRRYLEAMGLNGQATAPKVYQSCSSRRVLTMERLYGVPLTDLDSISSLVSNPETSLITALNVWFGSLLSCETFYADVHAGNLWLLRDGRIGFLDFGIVGRISPKTWAAMEVFLASFASEDYEAMASSLIQVGATNTNVDSKAFANDLEKNVFINTEPIGGEIIVSCESGLVDSVPKTEMERAHAEQLKNIMFSKSTEMRNEQGCYYTSVPRVVKHKGISGQELTSLNLDKTQLLESVLMKDYDGAKDLLLGELQFAFIAFLMGQLLEGFLQWKALVTLMFSSIEATRRLQELLETTLGWELQKNNTVDGFYEDDDEFAPVVEILDDTSFQESP